MAESLLKRIPGAGSWLSAGALYVFCRAFLYAMAVVLPPLFEHLRGSPRLEALALLGVWLSPIVLIAISHAAVTAILDRLDTHDAARSGARASGWAGLYSWLVALFATITTVLAVRVIHPPPPPDGDSLGVLGHVLDAVSPLGSGGLTLHTVLWIVFAALLYKVEQLSRRGRCREV